MEYPETLSDLLAGWRRRLHEAETLRATGSIAGVWRLALDELAELERRAGAQLEALELTDSEEVLTTRQAAKRLKLSQPAVARLCARGAFAGAYKTSGHTGDWRIPLEGLRAHQDGAPQPEKKEKIGRLWEGD